MLQAQGPRVEVRVGLYPAVPAVTCKALVDTGASRACIDGKLARGLGLSPVRRDDVAGAFGMAKVDVYLASIEVVKLGLSRVGEFTSASLESFPYHAIIGRDFLSDLSMSYCGPPGRVTLTLVE